MLHIYPLCGKFYFPWHIHQIEATDGVQCLLRKTHRYTISNVESQDFTHNNMPCSVPGIEPAISGMLSGRANQYLTAPPLKGISDLYWRCSVNNILVGDTYSINYRWVVVQ